MPKQDNRPPKPSNADKTAIHNGLRKAEAFLSVIMPIYLQASPAKKAELRLHNPTLDNFISFLDTIGMVV